MLRAARANGTPQVAEARPNEPNSDEPQAQEQLEDAQQVEARAESLVLSEELPPAATAVPGLTRLRARLAPACAREQPVPAQSACVPQEEQSEVQLASRLLRELARG